MMPDWTISRGDGVSRAALFTLIVGTVGMAVVAAITGALPKAFFAAFSPGAPIAIVLSCLVAVGAAAALVKTWSIFGVRIAISWWSVAALASLFHAAAKAGVATAWVSPAEAVMIALALLFLGQGKTESLLRLLVGGVMVMLVLFGAIHLVHHDSIAELIPARFPARDTLPFVTGTIMIIGAAGLLLPTTRHIAALVVAAMFASWIPLVHLPRILATPDDASEWIFALTALCLVGVLLAVAGSVPAPPLVSAPPEEGDA